MKYDRFITIIEIIIILILALLIVKRQLVVDKVENDFKLDSTINAGDYKKKYEADGLAIYEITYFNNPNLNRSYYTITIFNTTKNIYSLKGFNIVIRDKKNKIVKDFNVELLADIDPGDNIKYEYEYEGECYDMFDGSITYTPIHD